MMKNTVLDLWQKKRESLLMSGLSLCGYFFPSYHSFST